MRIKNKVITGLFCFLFAAFSVCNAKESSAPTLSAAPSPYPVMDSGVWADGIRNPEIYWLDNNRVIFKGSDEKEKTKHHTGKFNISIWELGKGIQVYAKDVVPGLCLNSDGIIYYGLLAKSPQGTEQYRYGKFGSEQTFAKPAGVKKFYWDRVNCKLTELTKILEQRKGRAITPLLDRHGYLELGPTGAGSSENNPITFSRTDGKVIELPLRRREVDRVAYFVFKDAYFVYGEYYSSEAKGVTNVWPKKVTRYVWWLYPDGRVEAVKFPDGPWVKETKPGSGYVTYNTVLYPTRHGYLLGTGKSKSTKDSGTVGAYLLRNDKLIKLVDGYFRSPAVSPDGCKVAFVHYPYADATIADDPAPITLKAVDLCPNKEEKRHGQ